ncbi:MAG: sulfatase [bacterium]
MSNPQCLDSTFFNGTCDRVSRPSRRGVFWLCLFLFGGLFWLSACDMGPDPRPDIVLVVLDTVRDDFTGQHGTVSVTPSLDQLAAEGTRFANAWSNASWTVPSHASMFTGLLPSEHGSTSRKPQLADSHETLAEILSGAGYVTAGFFSNPWLSHQASGLMRGFDVYQVAELKDFFDGASRRPDGDQGGRESVGRLTRWLEQAEDDRPFFLFVNFLEPHLPYDPPAEYRYTHLTDLSPDVWIPVRWGHEFNAGRLTADDVDWETVRRLYAGDIHTADRYLGRLVTKLKKMGRYENTVIIVTSDHGENLGEHGLVEHQFSVHETLLDVPLVIRAPGFLEPGQREDPVMLLDLFATVLEAAAIPDVPERPVSPLSRSLLSLPQNEPWSDRPLLAEYHGPPDGLVRLLSRINAALDPDPLGAAYRSLRVGDLRLTVSNLGAVQLHDLTSDPLQQHDLTAERPGDLARMQETLSQMPFGGWLLDEAAVPMDAETREKLRSLGYVH